MKTSSLSRLAVLCGGVGFVIGVWAQNQATLTAIGRWPDCPGLGWPVAVKVAGSYAYLAGEGFGGLRLVILDIAIPAQPRYVSHWDSQIAIDHLYPTLVRVQNHYAYIVAQGWYLSMLAVVDVTNPAEPRLLGHCQLPAQGGLVTSMDANEGHIYVAVPEQAGGAVLVVNASDPAHPVVESSVSFFGFGPTCVAVAGHYVYAGGGVVGNSDGLHVAVIDVSDPSSPSVVGGYDRPEQAGECRAICAQAGLLHLGYVYYAPDAGVFTYEVLDLSDPANPSPLGVFTQSHVNYPHTIRVAGEVAYLTNSDGLWAIDFADPSNPVLTSFTPYEMWNSEWDDFDIRGRTRVFCERAGTRSARPRRFRRAAGGRRLRCDDCWGRPEGPR